MSITEILPSARSLSRPDKFRLVRILLDDLATEEEESPFLGGAVFAIHTPEYAPEAAAQLALVLNQQEESKNECG